MERFRRLSLLVLSLIAVLETGLAVPKKVTVALTANFSAVVDTISDPTLNYPRKAAELALEEFRSQLLAKDIDLSFQEYDYQDEKIKTLETATEIAKSDALAVIGYTNSSDALLAGPILNRAGIPFLAPSSTADRVDDLGRFVRRVCFDDSFQGRVMADFALKQQKVKRAVIISVSDCAYCQSLRRAFKEKFEAEGGQVLADSTILSADTNFDELSKTLKLLGTIDAIFVPNYERTAARLVPQLIDAGVIPRMWLAGDGWGSSLQLFHKTVGRRSYLAFGIAHWRPEVKSPESKAFDTAFRTKYKLDPNDTAVLTYDATRLLLTALLKSKSLSRLDLIESIENLGPFKGASGIIAYKAGRRTPSKSAVLVRMQDGKLFVEKLIEESRGRL